MAVVKLPDPVWARLATCAEDRGVSVAELLVAAVGEIIKPRDRRERVLFYVRAGYTDGRVCEATGELRHYVAKVRREAGLPANRQVRSGRGDA